MLKSSYLEPFTSPTCSAVSLNRAQANRLLLRQQQLEQLLAEARGDKDPELLLETTNDILSRMRSKLKKQAAGV